MCGITGYFSLNNDFNPNLFEYSNNLIKHRGPDDFGYITINNNLEVNEWEDEYLRDFNSQSPVLGAMGFRRLAILDLSALGHQPMCDKETGNWIIFNGEIYNYIEIREELIAKAYIFISGTDTEVLLKAYREWGESCINKFNGMFSFCIFDKVKRKLFCARDRMGIKPFYYYLDGKRFVFGSEVKQIIPFLNGKQTANKTVLFDYLALGSYGNESEQTYLDSVLKLLPGEHLTINLNARTLVKEIKKYWSIQNIISSNFDCRFDEAVNKTTELFTDSVKLRMRSDVPIGTCLSGGIDSSAIACTVDELLKETDIKQKIFFIGSIDPKQDEKKFADIVINNINAEPHYYYPKPDDFQNDFENFIWHNDEPLIRASMFGGWNVYKLASQSGVKVVLDGQGADELLAGYYLGPKVEMLIEQFIKFRLKKFQNQLHKNSQLYDVSLVKILVDMARSFIKSRILQTLKSYGNIKYKRINENSLGFLNIDFIKNGMRTSKFYNKTLDLYNAPVKSQIKKRSLIQASHTSLPGILRQVDRNSMAFSVESRVPFLDYRLVELFVKTPIQWLINDGLTKYIFREAIKEKIPQTILKRKDKRGFFMPEQEFLEGSLDYVYEILNKSSSYKDVFNMKLDLENLKEMVKKEHYNNILWRTINSIIWFEKFQVNL